MDFSSIIRIILLFFIIAIISLASLFIYLNTGSVDPAEEMKFGITFSQFYAEDIKLDWKKAYLALLDDLGIKKLRLVAYWQKIEPEKGKYVFDDLDWQIQEAEKRNAEVILAMGKRVPRWPECHIPDWAGGLSEAEQQERILLLLEEIINHYQENKAIKIWQIENEPFLQGFGICSPLDEDFLDKEVSLIRKLDKKARPIMLTASGELSSWTEPASRGDILGTTLYRTIYNKWLGYFDYPLKPVFYHKRAKLLKTLK